MGVTIHHKLNTRKDTVKKTLDRTEQLAKAFQKQAENFNISFDIDRKSDFALYINIKGCETLCFNFKSVKDIVAEYNNDGYSYEYAVLTDDGKNKLNEGYSIATYPQNEIYYTADFCKTQFGESTFCHFWVAELIRKTASYCNYAEISDEADYYDTGELKNARENISALGKMIEGLGEKLQDNGYDIIKGGETKIK
jgi:hypothetical protein